MILQDPILMSSSISNAGSIFELDVYKRLGNLLGTFCFLDQAEHRNGTPLLMVLV